jgi:hypothetical protein
MLCGLSKAEARDAAASARPRSRSAGASAMPQPRDAEAPQRRIPQARNAEAPQRRGVSNAASRNFAARPSAGQVP